MKTRQPTDLLWGCFALVGCLCLLGLNNGTGTPRRSPRPDRVADFDDEAKAKRINAQLDEILTVQADTLKRYDELLEELQAVKARASR